MTETVTTVREMAYALSVDEPGATLEEHLAALLEVAGDAGLDYGPATQLTEPEADALLHACRTAFGDDVDDQADRDRADLGDPDAAYDRWVDDMLCNPDPWTTR